MGCPVTRVAGGGSQSWVNLGPPRAARPNWDCLHEGAGGVLLLGVLWLPSSLYVLAMVDLLWYTWSI